MLVTCHHIIFSMIQIKSLSYFVCEKANPHADSQLLFHSHSQFTKDAVAGVMLWRIYVFICVLTDIADAICFLLVGPSDMAAKSSVEVFISVALLTMTSSSAVAERPHDASCLSIVSFSSTIC